MGASFYWKPLGSGKRIDVGPRSEFKRILGIPCRFNERDIDFLRGVAAGNEYLQEPIQDILDAIEKHGTISVWDEY